MVSSLMFLIVLISLNRYLQTPNKKPSKQKHASLLVDLLVMCSISVAIISTTLVAVVIRWKRLRKGIQMFSDKQRLKQSSVESRKELDTHEIHFRERPNVQGGENWLNFNCTKRRFRNVVAGEALWGLVFMITIWNIWKSRNMFVFQKKEESMYCVVQRIKMMVEDCKKVWEKGCVKHRKIVPAPRWSKPDFGVFKLNTDGSVLTNPVSAAGGGLIRDHMGNWIVGFTKFLGSVSITVAELLALREGLLLAWDRKYPAIIAEIDSEVIYKLLRSIETTDHPLEPILAECRALLRKPWNATLVHNRRTVNTCADVLAKKGHHLVESFILWEEPPVVLTPLLADEANM